MQIDFSPKAYHRLEMIADRSTGGDQVGVEDEERQEEPGAEVVHRGHDREAAERGRERGPAADDPDERAAHDLHREEHVQQREVGDLLERVQLPLGRLRGGVGLADEDAPAGSSG